MAIAPPPPHAGAGGPRTAGGRPAPSRGGPAPARSAGAAEPAMLFLQQPLRVTAFTLLALFVGQRWARLVRPASGSELLWGTVVAIAVGLAVLALPHLRRPGHRAATVVAPAAVLAVLALAGALLAAGIPLELLAPRRWGELTSGLGDGIAAVPDLRVPYRGDDPWILATIALGGGLLLTLAAVLCLHGRGRPRAGPAVLLGAYTLSVIQVEQKDAVDDGLILAILGVALLLGDRIQMRQAWGAGLALLTVLGGALVLQPRLDAGRPWIDYRKLTERLGERPTARFDWTQTYAPLPWTRHGRQVLRIKSARPAYWRGVTLDAFDGTRWTRGATPTPGTTAEERSTTHPGWYMKASVAVRDMRSHQLYAPGEILTIDRSSTTVTPDTPGTVVTVRRPITRGDTYAASVYSPNPTPAELRAAGDQYPYPVRRTLSIRLPSQAPPPGSPRVLGPEVVFPAYGASGDPVAFSNGGSVPENGDELLRASPYRRTWALAQRLKAQSTSPYDYVLRVQARLRAGATYDERPPASRVPLESFIFDTRRGYCQQFSGAMALLLRMGGVPARVVEGFAPGTLDTGRGEWVVRDSDAHAWDEIYVPRVGWVTVDPTPAVAPASSQVESVAPVEDEEDPRGGAVGGGDRATDVPSATGGGGGGGGDDGGVPLVAQVLIALATLLAAGGAVRRMRGSRRPAGGGDPALDELTRALSRAGWPIPPGATLESIAAGFILEPEAGEYVRALARARYDVPGAPGTVRPTRAARQALRRGLTGSGPLGRLRGYWALPPVLPGGRPTLRRSDGLRV
jgi:transglutaminase-like putative cysteine protease